MTLSIRGPSLRERAVELVKDRGIATTRELQAAGVHRCYLGQMCREGLLLRIGRGAYRLPAAIAGDEPTA
jgi:predicted transcriptional regulator of viral defense system